MPAIDVHGMAAAEALGTIIKTYNSEVRMGLRTKLRVIHGYGSTGTGGVIRLALRAHLASHNVRFETGEYSELNPGITTIIVGDKPISEEVVIPQITPDDRWKPPPLTDPAAESLSQFEVEYLRLTRRIAEQSTRIESLTDQLRILEQENRELPPLRQANERLHLLEAANRVLQERTQDLNSQLRELCARSDKQQLTLLDQDKKLSELSSTCRRYSEKCERLEWERDRFKSSYEQLRKQIETKQNVEKATLTDRVEIHSRQLKRLHQRIAELVQENEQLRIEREKLTESATDADQLRNSSANRYGWYLLICLCIILFLLVVLRG